MTQVKILLFQKRESPPVGGLKSNLNMTTTPVSEVSEVDFY